MPTPIQGSTFGTARERARTDIVLEIKSTAQRRIAEDGEDRLSLRAVARELGVVSSALYRYFPSREQLLQELVDDAHRALAQQIQQAVRQADADRCSGWRACCTAARDWAGAHPHQFALVHGHPQPNDVLAPLTGSERARLAWTLLLALLGFDLLSPGGEGLFGQGVEALAALLTD